MRRDDFTRRAKNAILGLALGDALSWPSLYHRSQQLPPWTRRLRREIDAQREEAGVIRVPMPFSLNQPAELLGSFPVDDAEWAAWTMRRLLRAPSQSIAGVVVSDWKVLAEGGEQVRGAVSTQAALANIRRGILPPASGRENPHYFDDGAFCRAVPIGIANAGEPAIAAHEAVLEASATNAEDGIWGAGAVAAAVSSACSGAGLAKTMEAAMQALPGDSWTRTTVDHALLLGSNHDSRLGFIHGLQGILNVEYSDGCVGPESLALILAIVGREGANFEDALFLSLAFPRGADAVPAIVGAVCGALADSNPIPESWLGEFSTLQGVCLPSLKGADYVRLAEEFAAACSQGSNVRETP
jgi:ADP-ribosylglycohydrolase